MNTLRCLALLVVCFFFVTSLAHADDAKKELEKFAGKWTVVSVDHGGNKSDEAMLKQLNLILVITGDKYSSKSGDNELDKGTIKVDPSKTPKAIDIMTGMGTSMPAIYEIKDDEMKVCYDLDGKERPKEFKTAAGTNQLYVVYKKAK